MKTPKISIAVPYHDIPETAFFLSRLLRSIDAQSFKDYEVVLLKKGRMGETYNEVIRQCKGELIKLMGMDDYFYHPDALQDIVNAFDEETKWLVTECIHDNGQGLVRPHSPQWNDKVYAGFNTVGGFSVITLRNKDIPLINEDLDWVVDCDWYWRIFLKNGIPKILNTLSVVIGIGEHQTTNTLSEEQKQKEYEYVAKQYA